MTILSKLELQVLQSKINLLPSDRYELSEILGDYWPKIIHPTEYGKQVRQTIASGLLKSIKVDGRKSNNHLVYKIRH